MKTSEKVGHSLPKRWGNISREAVQSSQESYLTLDLKIREKTNQLCMCSPLARRRNKQRGRTAARYGRRHKDTVRRSEVFNEGSDNPLLLHSIPGRINRNRGVPHNMQEIVSSNRDVAKKH